MPPEQPLEPAMLRALFGRIPTGVSVVTALAPDGRPIGVTIGSVTALSLAPPLLLFCLGRDNPDVAAFEAAGHFAVNALAADQAALSDSFAGSDEGKWQNGTWRSGQSGLPLLAEALVVFECCRHACHDNGDHLILIGEIESCHDAAGGEPLVHHGGAYRRLAPRD